MTTAKSGSAVRTGMCTQPSRHSSAPAAEDISNLEPGVFRVRLWFGPHEIADYVAEAALARRYAASIRRRFPGLDVTVEDFPEPTALSITAAGSTSTGQVQTASPSMTPLPSETALGTHAVMLSNTIGHLRLQ